MSLLPISSLFGAPFIFGSLLLLMPISGYADLSMKPRTCSNCSGFGTASPSYQHKPSGGFSGHQSYRPKTYDSFKHSGKRHYQRDKPHYRDYRPKFDNHRHHYRPHGSYHHSGIGLSIVAPTALAILALRLLWLQAKWSAQSAPDLRVTKGA